MACGWGVFANWPSASTRSPSFSMPRKIPFKISGFCCRARRRSWLVFMVVFPTFEIGCKIRDCSRGLGPSINSSPTKLALLSCAKRRIGQGEYKAAVQAADEKHETGYGISTMIIRRMTAVLAALWMLAACSPEFNWRKVQLEQTGLSAMLPGKPNTSHRVLDFDQYPLDFYLTTATAGGQIYTVGHVILPAQLQQDPAARERLYEALHESLRAKFVPDGQASQNSA